jgi:hypothetical protein
LGTIRRIGRDGQAVPAGCADATGTARTDAASTDTVAPAATRPLFENVFDTVMLLQ